MISLIPIIARPLETQGDRLRVIGMRLAFGLGWVAAFAVGSIGAFLVFPWPPLLREIVLTYLQVFLIIRLTMVFGRFLLAPNAPRSRIVPMDDISAQYWLRWLAVLVGWFFFARFSLGLLARLDTSTEASAASSSPASPWSGSAARKWG